MRQVPRRAPAAHASGRRGERQSCRQDVTGRQTRGAVLAAPIPLIYSFQFISKPLRNLGLRYWLASATLVNFILEASHSNLWFGK